MNGLDFVTSDQPGRVHPARADVACFVGFVARRNVRARRPGESDASFLRQLPAALRDWYADNDWAPGRHGRTVDDFVALRDLPVPVESWENFDALFASDDRLLFLSGSTLRAETYLGAAVREFFARGGRLCYIVRLGDPWPLQASAAVRREAARLYLPTFPPVSPVDRASWRGLGHLFGLPGVSFLATPDFPDVYACEQLVGEPFSPVLAREEFVECASRVSAPSYRELRGAGHPVCDEAGFRAWREAVNLVGGFIARPAHGLREIQFVATIPLPMSQLPRGDATFAADRVLRSRQAQWSEVGQIGIAFVQLVYPWLRPSRAGALPDGLTPPDGYFIGQLAASALRQGSWTPLLQEELEGVVNVEPVLPRSVLDLRIGEAGKRIQEHVTILGPSSAGLRVLSDVTTDNDQAYRSAAVNRLVVAIVRAARVTGQDLVFANNGSTLWRQLTDALDRVMESLWAEGALAGVSAAEAFTVTCDRSTMTQADLDAGRLIARIVFTAAQPITRIVVVLDLQESGDVSPISVSAVPAQEVA